MNFMLADAVGTFAATVALTPFLFAPGYVAGWALDIFNFRRRYPLMRLILVVPLAMAICPISSYLLCRLAPLGLWMFYGGSTAVCLLLLAREIRHIKPEKLSKSALVTCGLLALWLVIATASLVDLQIGDKLYPSLAAYDHSTRVAMMAAIARQVPPNNPFFAHPDVPLRYHYLWILLCSLPLKLLHLSVRHLVYAGVIWGGVGLIGTLALGFEFLLQQRGAIARKTLIGVALLCVTGLDILAILVVAALGRSWLADMEWWNNAPIASWAASLIWVPHNIAALVAGLVGFILLRHAAETSSKWSLVAVVVAGTAFASAAGMSLYVAFTVAVAIALWTPLLIIRARWKELLMFLGAGVVASALLLPFLFSLKGPGAGTAFAEIAIRRFFGPAQIGPITAATNALLLPMGYILELGVFLLAGIVRFKQVLRKQVAATTGEVAGWTLVAASFLVGTFLRSSTISTNDLGIRGLLLAQFMLLLWAAIIIHDWWFEPREAQATRRFLAPAAFALALVLGVLGTAYEVFMIRFSPLIYDRWGNAGLSWMDPDWKFGKRNYALRSLYEAVNAQLSPSAIIQHNPITPSFVSHRLYSGHDEVAGGPNCGTAFGGDTRMCEERVDRLVALFANRGNLESVCRDYGIDVLVAKDTDPAWRDPTSWIWNRPPMVSNDHARAFRCGTATARGSSL